MRKRSTLSCIGLLVTLSLAYASAAAAPPPPEHWVGTWATSVQIPEPQNALPPEEMTDTTLRQIVHLSIGGNTIRVHLSNAFGTTPLRLTAVHVARPANPASSEIDASTDRALTFNGSAEVVIPPGAQYISDPIDFPAPAMSDLAISLYLDEAPARETGHPGSRATTYIAKRNVVDARVLTEPKTVEHWYIISGIDVIAAPNAFSVVALGDSITDGHAATTNGNDRWTDALARKLQSSPATRNIAVLNHGIGGNHLLIDGLGPNALARFDRDVLAQAGVRYLIVLEGINDLGGLARLKEPTPEQHALLVKRIIGAYQQIITRAHAEGIKVIGATILPDDGSAFYHPGPQDDADRRQVNDWIKAPGHFDDAVDLEKLLADPGDPNRLLPAYDCGDHLHPSPAGYKVMGEAFSANLFK